jgi:hypothetical protein
MTVSDEFVRWRHYDDFVRRHDASLRTPWWRPFHRTRLALLAIVSGLRSVSHSDRLGTPK